MDLHENEHRAPTGRDVVVDEAQRAWDKEHCYLEYRRKRREIEAMASVKERHAERAAVVALIGPIQELDTGQAGPGERVRVLSTGFTHRRVHVPPDSFKRVER